MQVSKITVTNGRYTTDEANELLFRLINSELNKQKLKNYSSMISNEQPCEVASSKINELQELSSTVVNLLQKAKAEKKKINIESSFNISFED
jgi:hypothetical protein